MDMAENFMVETALKRIGDATLGIMGIHEVVECLKEMKVNGSDSPLVENGYIVNGLNKSVMLLAEGIREDLDVLKENIRFNHDHQQHISGKQ